MGECPSCPPRGAAEACRGSLWVGTQGERGRERMGVEDPGERGEQGMGVENCGEMSKPCPMYLIVSMRNNERYRGINHGIVCGWKIRYFADNRGS